jgi:hypothetical protein
MKLSSKTRSSRRQSAQNNFKTGANTSRSPKSSGVQSLFPLLGERARVRADNTTKLPSPPSQRWQNINFGHIWSYLVTLNSHSLAQLRLKLPVCGKNRSNSVKSRPSITSSRRCQSAQTDFDIRAFPLRAPKSSLLQSSFPLPGERARVRADKTANLFRFALDSSALLLFANVCDSYKLKPCYET